MCKAQQLARCDGQPLAPICPLSVKCCSSAIFLQFQLKIIGAFFFLHRILSEDDLHLLEIPEPPTIVSKTDNRSSIGSGSAITSEPKASTKITLNKSQQQYQPSQSSIMFEMNDNASNAHDPIETASTDEKSSINHLKNIVHKLQTVNYHLVFLILNKQKNNHIFFWEHFSEFLLAGAE